MEHIHIECEIAILILIDEFISQYVVVHSALRTSLDEHIALDAAILPVVLVFQITAVAEAEHLHGKAVLALLQELGDIEMGRQTAIFTIAHHLAVDPEIEGRFYAFEIHDHIHALPVFRHGKFVYIMSYRVVILWYERRICLERIGYIGVDWRIEALQLPAARHIDVLPIAYVIGCLEEIGQGKTRILHQFEFPYTIQRAAALILGVQLETAGVVHLQLCQGSVLTCKRQVMSGHRHAVDMGHGGVLPRV